MDMHAWTFSEGATLKRNILCDTLNARSMTFITKIVLTLINYFIIATGVEHVVYPRNAHAPNQLTKTMD